MEGWSPPQPKLAFASSLLVPSGSALCLTSSTRRKRSVAGSLVAATLPPHHHPWFAFAPLPVLRRTANERGTERQTSRYRRRDRVTILFVSHSQSAVVVLKMTACTPSRLANQEYFYSFLVPQTTKHKHKLELK